MVVDYQNSKIYKLWSPSQNLVYIGSTTQNLAVRKGEHCRCFKKWQNGKCNFVTSFTVLECEDNRIDLLEAYPCSNKMELLKREGYWIKKLSCVNKVIPYITNEEKKEYHKEYRQNNKKEILEKAKEYYAKNQEQINEKTNEYGKVKCICLCGSNFRQDSIGKHIKSEKHQTFLNSSKQAVIILVG